MAKRTSIKVKRWQRILNFPCFGDWDCLTSSYRFQNGVEQYHKCLLQKECKQKFYEQKERNKDCKIKV